MSLPGLTCASSAYPRHPAVKTKLRLFVVVASGRTEKQRIFSREPFFLTPAQVRLTNMLPAKCLLKSHSFRFFLGQFSGLVSRQGNLRRPSSCVLSCYVRILPGYRVPYPGTSGPQLVFFHISHLRHKRQRKRSARWRTCLPRVRKMQTKWWGFSCPTSTRMLARKEVCQLKGWTLEAWLTANQGLQRQHECESSEMVSYVYIDVVDMS